MAKKDIVPIKISLTEGDFYTLWAPRWRERGEEWEAFLGWKDDLYGFTSPEELLLFLESDAEHDLTSHPRWSAFHNSGEQRVVPSEEDYFDLIGTPALLCEAPDNARASTVARNFHLARSLAETTDTPEVLSVFSSYSILANVDKRGVAGAQRDWTTVGRIVLEKWDGIIDALDKLVSTPEVSGDTQAALSRIEQAQELETQKRHEQEQQDKENKANADPYDSTVWAQSGIDPIKVSINGRSIYTLRTYLNKQPVFLGKYGEIFSFPSAKALVRWLVEHDDHDLAAMSTWEDIMTLAHSGDLTMTVHEDNVYSFNGIARDIATGTHAVDTQQMARAYELLADAADWAADDSLNSFFLANPRMQDYISYLLGDSQTTGYTPTPPFDEHSQAWKELEEMFIKRLSKI
ncbi:hypothetical protein [Corynebacterium sp. sy039]|uniref:hypothetical protein n=1 Tax=Corynebacterium sp. sy039 TaxID=2599641 RepID=UPI0011B74AB7|nr:hypothetical protein [Corynebacterium sp. sy039]QDZ42092.1 hypothetical protein FQV43_02070 [Corynebacterium sp. sy039]